jgi:hypothetical protein
MPYFAKKILLYTKDLLLLQMFNTKSGLSPISNPMIFAIGMRDTVMEKLNLYNKITYGTKQRKTLCRI